MPEVQPAVQYADLRQQDHAARLGMWGFLSTEVLFFGGLMLMYVRYRMAYAEGFVEAAQHTQIVIGTINTAVLLTSSFLVAWAFAAAKLGATRLVAILLGSAALLGVLFLGLKVIEYAQEYHEHLVPGWTSRSKDRVLPPLSSSTASISLPPDCMPSTLRSESPCLPSSPCGLWRAPIHPAITPRSLSPACTGISWMSCGSSCSHSSIFRGETHERAPSCNPAVLARASDAARADGAHSLPAARDR